MATIKKISGLSSVTTPGSTDKLLVEDSSGNLKYTTVGGVNNHTHSYAGSSSAGGPATEFTAELANGNTDRYVYFAWDATDYNNSNASSIAKGKAVIDTEFKYNPSTNKLSTGSVQLNSKVTLQYNSSTESLDFVFA